jgi:hypothetical protein
MSIERCSINNFSLSYSQGLSKTSIHQIRSRRSSSMHLKDTAPMKHIFIPRYGATQHNPPASCTGNRLNSAAALLNHHQEHIEGERHDML